VSEATHSSTPLTPKFGALILAAGSSSRLGQPKQLLVFKGQPLIVRTAEATLAAGASPVIVVLGANAEKIRAVLVQLPVVIVENAAWSEGMGSSIRTGLLALESAAPTLDAALIAVCDQPHFSATATGKLCAALSGDVTISATRHAAGAGVPALFTRAHFPALRALRGHEGARQIIAAHAATTAIVELPELALDIDTPEDRARLQG